MLQFEEQFTQIPSLREGATPSVTEPGEFELMIGDKKAKFIYK
jgi:hypothetical protein